VYSDPRGARLNTTASTIFAVALIGGGLAGAILSGARIIAVDPLILRAESYEVAATDGPTTGAAPWAPRQGVERTAYTALMSTLTAIGFGLILSAAIALRGRPVGWRNGLAWGLAGFAAVHVAPALGLSPALPGAPAEALVERQIWWVATVALSAGGIAIIAFAQRTSLTPLGLVLLAAPHIVGAPAGGAAAGLAPADLERSFVYASMLTNGIFWLALGGLSGMLFNRFQGVRPPSPRT
jgi:cobalt transporter subunit CbtA